MTDCLNHMIEHRRWLHQHPELAFEERETTAYIARQLRSLGIPFRQTGESGIIADIMVDQALPTIAVRAEIDAVPIHEETELSFASIHEGAMHACGHDANTALLLALAEVLVFSKQAPSCNVRLIFEPAEEIGAGAHYMILQGALQNPMPSQFLLFHFGNQETRGMEIQQSVSTALIRGLHITVCGSASHFGQYREGIDAMYAAARLVTETHRINETCRTRQPFILGLGFMRAGCSGNIVADHAEMKGSLRAFSHEDSQTVYQQLLDAAAEIEQDTGAAIQIEVTREIPPIVNDGKMVEKGCKIGTTIFGGCFQLGTKPFLVGDNAAYYLQHVPGMRVVFLAGKQDAQAYPVHNSKFDIDERVMEDALAFFEHYFIS